VSRNIHSNLKWRATSLAKRWREQGNGKSEGPSGSRKRRKRRAALPVKPHKGTRHHKCLNNKEKRNNFFGAAWDFHDPQWEAEGKTNNAHPWGREWKKKIITRKKGVKLKKRKSSDDHGAD